MSLALPQTIQILEQVDRERFEMHAFMPLSAAAPMALGDPGSRGEALALFAKWVAIQRMHGAPESDLMEFALNYIGLGGKTGQEVSDKSGELAQGIIAIAQNMLVCCEHLQKGQSVAEVQKMGETKGKLTPDVLVPVVRRAQELVQYSRETGIGPFDYEHRRAQSAGAGAQAATPESWTLVFQRVGMGYSDEEIEDAVARTGMDVTVKWVVEFWDMIRHCQGREAMILSAIREATEDADERKQREIMFEGGKEALRKCQEHPAYSLLESFEASQRLNGKLGCLQIPIGLVVFSFLLFTALSWWVSLLLAFALTTAMVIGRGMWDKRDISRTAAGILKACPQGTPQYVEAYRLFSKAQERDGANEELKQVVAKLPAVDTTAGSAAKASAGPPFHGFFYSNDKEGNPVRLEMSPLQQQAFSRIAEGDGWRNLDEVTYWKACYRFVLSAVGQGYIAWKGRSYWLFYTAKLNPKEKDAPYGVHLVEFTKNRMRYRWIETGKLGAFTGALRNLLEVLCNWGRHNVGVSRAKRLAPADLAILKNNIDWTGEMHERMGAQYPGVVEQG